MIWYCYPDLAARRGNRGAKKERERENGEHSSKGQAKIKKACVGA